MNYYYEPAYHEPFGCLLEVTLKNECKLNPAFSIIIIFFKIRSLTHASIFLKNTVTKTTKERASVETISEISVSQLAPHFTHISLLLCLRVG